MLFDRNNNQHTHQLEKCLLVLVVNKIFKFGAKAYIHVHSNNKDTSVFYRLAVTLSAQTRPKQNRFRTPDIPNLVMVLVCLVCRHILWDYRTFI